MERLPKKYERLFLCLTERGKKRFVVLRGRHRELDRSDVIDEYLMLKELDELGYVTISRDENGDLKGESLVLDASQEDVIGNVGLAIDDSFNLYLTYPDGFFVRAKGLVYLSEKRRDLRNRVAAAVLTALLGGGAAWLFLRLFPLQ